MTIQLPRAKWNRQWKSNPNEYHLITFDPGGAATGWTHFVIDLRAFSRPEHKVLAHLLSWDCGEFTGHENVQLVHAADLMRQAKFGNRPTDLNNRTDYVTEDFDLTQLIGGKNLLSPVRINAVLDWECAKLGSTLQYQNRTLRTNITPERLNLFGFAGKWKKTGVGKDEFAAMQHAVVWLRRIKQGSVMHPWKLSDGIVHNAVWDCSCARTTTGRKTSSTKRTTRNGMHHDLVHP